MRLWWGRAGGEACVAGIAQRLEDSPWSEASLPSSSVMCNLCFLRAGAGSFEGVGGSSSGHGRVVDRVLRAGGDAMLRGVVVEVAGEEEEAAAGW